MTRLVALRLKAPPRPTIADTVAPIRFRRVPGMDGKVLVTNDQGAYHVFGEDEFQSYLAGALDPLGEPYAELLDKHFLLGDSQAAIDAVREKNRHVFQGPSLHILAVTLRCNQNCHYCHSSKVGPSAAGVDMPMSTAKTIVDRIFESPSPQIHIEFQGGEPLLAWETIQGTVRYAREKNQGEQRDLAFTVVSNLSLMDEAKLDWLIEEGVMICTSLDGPKDLHDANRPYKMGSSYDHVVGWIDRIHETYVRRGVDLNLARVNALLTVTRNSLTRAKDIVDEYIRRDLKAVALRTLDPFGFARPLWHKLGYTGEEFMAFWEEALEYAVERNLAGDEIVEKNAAMFLTKIMTPRDPNHMDWRSPCGAAIGQIAYNYDGSVYTCDEGRMVAEMGDELFRIGGVGETYESWIRSDTARAVTAASTLDSQPYCSTCAYKPYCGVCPVYNYVAQGDVVGQMPSNDRCKTSMGMQDYLFRRLANDTEGQVRKVFERWTFDRDRSSLYQRDGI
jgi:His-Xaa-Ser system radical SAM maturase HxsB